MHQSIRDNLEEYLRGSADKIPQEFHAHLEACRACASELKLVEQQARMLRVLQAGREMEPRAGFYARVLGRIEEQGPFSIWSVLLQPRFGRRLAVASAVLALLLAGYLVSTEPGDQGIGSAPMVVMTDTPPAPEAAAVPADTPQQQRDAVLVNLASFRQ
jgi:anti-sigma factor RsiW